MQVQRRLGAAALLVGALAAIWSVYTAPAAAQRDLFDELYARGQKQNADLRTLTATFTETTTSSLLTRPLVARGTVAVERPARVVLKYSEPDDRAVLIDGDRMTMTWPSRRLRQVKDIGASQRRIQKYFVDSPPDELRSHFEISAREAEDRPAYLVTLTPRRKQIQQGLTRLELWIDRTSLLMSAMRMRFPNGDTKMMTFNDVRPNARIEPGTFEEGRASGSRR
jgi:outer membrane lipoprotein-sorting protein